MDISLKPVAKCSIKQKLGDVLVYLLRHASHCLDKLNVYVSKNIYCFIQLHYRGVIMGATYGVPNYQPHDCLLNRLFRHRSKKTSKLHVTGLCAGNSPMTGEFPAQMVSNAENVSIWWRHHVSDTFSTMAVGTIEVRSIRSMALHSPAWADRRGCRLLIVLIFILIL